MCNLAIIFMGFMLGPGCSISIGNPISWNKPVQGGFASQVWGASIFTCLYICSICCIASFGFEHGGLAKEGGDWTIGARKSCDAVDDCWSDCAVGMPRLAVAKDNFELWDDRRLQGYVANTNHENGDSAKELQYETFQRAKFTFCFWSGFQFLKSLKQNMLRWNDGKPLMVEKLLWGEMDYLTSCHLDDEHAMLPAFMRPLVLPTSDVNNPK